MKTRKPKRIAKGRVYVTPHGTLIECLGTRGTRSLMRVVGENGSPVAMQTDVLLKTTRLVIEVDGGLL
jgi:hypothetical protein